jgi:hypothetical protein
MVGPRRFQGVGPETCARLVSSGPLEVSPCRYAAARSATTKRRVASVAAAAFHFRGTHEMLTRPPFRDTGVGIARGCTSPRSQEALGSPPLVLLLRATSDSD